MESFDDWYIKELRHLRETAGEFAEAFPKIAGRLSLNQNDVADPYVERLLEGFAFMAARVQMKLAAQFPDFTQRLLQTVYPHLAVPIPSITIARFEPALEAADVGEGCFIERGTVMRSLPLAGGAGTCEFRTAHGVELWPIGLTRAAYTAAFSDLALPARMKAQAVLRFELQSLLPRNIGCYGLDRLSLHLSGTPKIAGHLLEAVLSHAKAVLILDPAQGNRVCAELTPAQLRPVGLAQDESLLHFTNRSFQGYRLLQEYFAFPQRFLFFELSGLQEGLRQMRGTKAEIAIVLDECDPSLQGVVQQGDLSLFATPAINLMHRRFDRIPVGDSLQEPEWNVVVDRHRAHHFEVFEVTEVEGYDKNHQQRLRFEPLYRCGDPYRQQAQGAYFSTRRAPRTVFARQAQRMGATAYAGDDVFVSLVDQAHQPFPSSIAYLGGAAWVTHGNLPTRMPLGGSTDLVLIDGKPVKSIRCIRKPSEPRPAVSEDSSMWQLIDHLHLNHLASTDLSPAQGVAALSDLLRLYAQRGDPGHASHANAVLDFKAEPCMQRIPGLLPLIMVRGVRTSLKLDEDALGGYPAFLLGLVLDQFLARHVSINSFSQLTLSTPQRGERCQWPPHIGLRPLS